MFAYRGTLELTVVDMRSGFSNPKSRQKSSRNLQGTSVWRLIDRVQGNTAQASMTYTTIHEPDRGLRVD